MRRVSRLLQEVVAELLAGADVRRQLRRAAAETADALAEAATSRSLIS